MSGGYENIFPMLILIALITAFPTYILMTRKWL